MPGVLERFQTLIGRLGASTPAQTVLAELRDEIEGRESRERAELESLHTRLRSAEPSVREPAIQEARERALQQAQRFRLTVYPDPTSYARVRTVLEGPEELQRDVLFEAVQQLGEQARGAVGWGFFLPRLCNVLLAQKLPLQPAELAALLRLAARPVALAELSLPVLLKRVEAPVDEQLRDALELIDQAASRHLKPNAYQKLAAQLEPLLGRKASSSLAIGGPFSEAVFARLEAMPAEEAQRWRELFQLGFTVTGPRPAKKWAEQVRALAFDEEAFVAAARTFLALGPVPDGDRDEFVPETDVPFLRGLVFAVGALQVAALAPDVGAFALACFRKVALHGPVCPGAGNACLWTLGEIGLDGVGQLGKLKTRVKYSVALRLIDKALKDAAERAGLSPDDLEEVGVPTCDLDEHSRFEQGGGDVTARIEVEPEGLVTLGFFIGGKPHKTALKGTAELKALKARVKDLEAMLVAQRLRLERLFLSDRAWPYATWSSRFLHHPLLQTFVRRLVWRRGDGRTFVGADIEARPDELVTLWHPLDGPAGDVDVDVQPFKQLGRETFELTAAEATERLTNRFAGRRIQQHRLAALCRERGWQYRLQGEFDGHNDAVLVLPRWGLTATFGLNPPMTGGTTGMGIYVDVETDGLAFDFEGEPPPPRVLSEVMRDVSLFIRG